MEVTHGRNLYVVANCFVLPPPARRHVMKTFKEEEVELCAFWITAPDVSK
jgi:hypothetical protein